jgi:hypothetical protein
MNLKYLTDEELLAYGKGEYGKLRDSSIYMLAGEDKKAGEARAREFNEKYGLHEFVGVPEEYGVLGHGIEQGAGWGFGDEITAAGSAGVAKLKSLFTDDEVDTGKAYDEALEARRMQKGQFEHDNQMTALAAELGGAVAPAILGARGGGGMAAVPLTNRMLRLAGLGGAAGAVSGFGHGEGTDDRFKQAGTGGAFGAALGVTVPAVGSVGRWGWKKTKTAIPRFGGNAAARQRMDELIKNSGFKSVEDVQKALKELGPDATISDLSTRLKGEAERISQLPGAGQDLAEQFIKRNADAGRRVAEDVDKLFGGRVRIDQFVEDIVGQSEQKASPLYEKIKPRPVKMTPELRAILNTRTGKRAFAKAKGLASDDMRVMPELLNFKSTGKSSPYGQAYKTGEEISSREIIPDIEALMTIRRALSTIIAKSGKTPMGKLTPEGKVMVGLKARLNKELYRQHPELAEADKIYGGLAETIEAAEEGAKFWNKTDYQIKRLLRDMSESEADAYRLGGLQKIYDEAMKVTEGGSAYDRMINSAAKANKIKALLQDDEAFEALKQALKREQTYHGVYKVTQNSATARRLLAEQEANPSLLTSIVGGPKAAAMQLAAQKAKTLGTTTLSQREELAKLLGSKEWLGKAYKGNPEMDRKLRKVAEALAVGQGYLSGR